MHPLSTTTLLQAVVLQVALFLPAWAQVSESFTDGDFTHDPEWQGETTSWTIVPSGDAYALQTAGAARADTIHLATSSRVAYGMWSFTFAHASVNLSNFNGARVYLIADSANLEGDVRGYFIQLGTNNSDEIRLYRQDGSAVSRRVELARSAAAILKADTHALGITATRTPDGQWSVYVNGKPIFAVLDDTYTSSSYFGIWVKHTPETARAYTFDDLEARFEDSQAPRVLFAEQIDDTQIDVYFDEVLDSDSAKDAWFDIDGLMPESVQAVSDTQFRIAFGDGVLPVNTEWQLHVQGVRDIAGNALISADVTVAQLANPGDLVINEIMYAPLSTGEGLRPAQPEYIELYNRSAVTLALHRLYRTREPDKTGDADTLHFGASRIALPPKSFAVVFADTSSTPAETQSTLSRAFPALDVNRDAAMLLPVRRATLGLRNEGDLIRIHRWDGTLLDEVRYTPEWHNPALVDSRGVSLERMDADMPGQQAANWTSSPDPAGGTPGFSNAASYEDASTPAVSVLSIEPSPFSPDQDGFEDTTTIHFRTSLPGGSIRIRIYDSFGRLVRTLTPAALTSPNVEYKWDGRDDEGRPLQIGIYIVALDAVYPHEGVSELHKEVVVLAHTLDG